MLEKTLGLRGWSSLLKQKMPQEETSPPEARPVAGRLVMPKLHFHAHDIGKVLKKHTLDAHLRLHKGYVDKTRELVQGTEYADMTLDEVLKKLKDEKSELNTNASQAWSHAYYWLSISPPGIGTAPVGPLLEAVSKTFGSVDKCRNELIKAGQGIVGSGWIWAVKNKDKPEVIVCKDAATPYREEGLVPLLCIDVWEHAYYLDYTADRDAYLDAAVKDLINWKFADRFWMTQ